MTSSYPKVYLYRRIVQAKLFIDDHYHEQINLDDDVVQNQTAMNEILKTLPSPQ